MSLKASDTGRLRRSWTLVRYDFGRFRASLFRSFRMRPRVLLLFAFVLLGAVLIRLPGLDRPPQIPFTELYTDEYKMLSNTMNVLRGKPLLPHWPYGLYRWLQPQIIAKALMAAPRIWQVKGSRVGIGEVGYIVGKVDARSSMRLLRLNALFFGLALLLVVFVLARQVAGDYPAIAATALAAASPVLVAYSRMLYYDLPMALWFWSTVAVLAWTMRNRSLTGVYFGAALLAWTVTTKQSAITLAPLWGFTAIYALSKVEDVPWYRALVSKHMFLAGVLGLIVFFVNYPTLLDPEAWKKLGFLSTREHLAVSEDLRGRLWDVWLTDYWPGQAHPSILIVLLVGLFALPFLSRDKVTASFIVAATILYYALAGSMAHLTLRTIIPLIPGVCIGIAGIWLLAERYLNGRVAVALATCVTFLALASLLSNSIRQTLLIALPTTTAQAAAWVEANVPPMSKIAQETYTLRLIDVEPDRLSAKYARSRNLPAFEVEYVGSLGSEMPAFYRQHGYDYLVANERNLWAAHRVLKGMGQEVTPYDKRAPHIGKTPRYDLPLSQVLANYEAIDREFDTVAVFEPNRPENQDFKRSSYHWWEWESFIHPGAWDLWKNFDRYRLGNKETVYRVK